MHGDKRRCGAQTKSSSPWNGRLEISVLDNQGYIQQRVRQGNVCVLLVI
jgi:hypothetical protein